MGMSNTTTIAAKIYKLANPAKGEESARFTIAEDNGDRLIIRLVCDLPIAPTELVSREDVCPDSVMDIASSDFRPSSRIQISYGRDTVEDFIVTRIGRIDYAVSIQFGYSYTRPQFVQKYGQVAAAVVSIKGPR